MKIALAIEQVQRSEAELVRHLRALAERHAADADVHHLARDRALLAVDHIAALQPFAARYDAPSVDPPDANSPDLLEAVRTGMSHLLGRTEPAGVLLMRDLREAYVCAQTVELDWIVLQQGAKAMRERDLLATIVPCHEEAEATGSWLRTRIKTTAPQVLATR